MAACVRGYLLLKAKSPVSGKDLTFPLFASSFSVFGPHPVMPNAYSWPALRNHSWHCSEDHMGWDIGRLAVCKTSILSAILLLKPHTSNSS